MITRLEYDISRESPYESTDAIRRKSDLDVVGKRELAGEACDVVRLPIQHGRGDDVMPAWTVVNPSV